jgi:CMP/dCMP kinase
MDKQPFLITLDGTSGVGKGSVADRLSKLFSAPVLNSGAIYRILGFTAHEEGVNPQDVEALLRVCEQLNKYLSLTWDEATGSRFIFKGCDMADVITSEVSGRYASVYSVIPEVRAALVELQRQAITKKGIAEGRDMGTVIFPHAKYKFFLTASSEERAKRRFRQLFSKEPDGTDIQYLELLDALKERDNRDREREHSPTIPAEDAVVIDSTNLTLDQVIDVIALKIK